MHTETELFKRAFHYAKTSQNDFTLENATSVQFKIVTGNELRADHSTIQRMEEIYLQNYADFPQAFRDKVIASLHAKLNNPQARFYPLYQKGHIVAFNSFTPQRDGMVHFANFNVDPAYQFSKLGEAMMEANVDKEALTAPLIAEAVADSAIAHTYLTKKDFHKTGESTLAGVTLWHIRREQALAQAA